MLRRSVVAEHRSELAEDPRGGAPDVQPVDPVAAVAERPVADRPLDDLDLARPGRNASTGASRMRATSAGCGAAPGARRATATIGVDPVVADRDEDRVERPTTRTPAASGSRPISSAASRSAVADGSASSGSALPPGKLTSPLWWPS